MFDRKKLRQQIVSLFNEGELKTLCFDLVVDYDSLEGGEKATKVVALIAHLEKRGRLPTLLAWLAEERPHADWPSLETPISQSPISNPQSPPPLAPRPSPFWSPPYGEPDWVEIPAGPFWMGSDKGNEDGKPVHRLYLDTFYIARTPITNAQYALFAQAANHRSPKHWGNGQVPIGLENHPTTYVSWYDALAYCQWLSQVTGKKIRLPSEAEWEKAARGDKDKREYPWGGKFEPDRANTEEAGWGQTTPVGQYPDGASPYGVLEMCGNVWEWTRSLWGTDPQKPQFVYPYKLSDGRENVQAKDDVWRILRGGSWYSDKTLARCTFRSRYGPSDRSGYSGLRVGLSPF